MVLYTQLFGVLSRQANWLKRLKDVNADLMRDIMKDVLTFVSDIDQGD